MPNLPLGGSRLSKRIDRIADPAEPQKCPPIAAIFRQKKSRV